MIYYFYGFTRYLVHRQEGKTQRSANVRALPRGGGMP